jgi:hypothetical protein
MVSAMPDSIFFGGFPYKKGISGSQSLGASLGFEMLPIVASGRYSPYDCSSRVYPIQT